MEMPPERGGHAFDPKPGFPSTKGGRKSEKDWEQAQTKKAEQTYAKYCDKPDIWDFKAGSLTIVDLSCPFVDDGAACVLFNICLALFLKDRSGVGRVVALDEAHKVLVYVSFTSGEADAMVIQFMTGSAAATTFTESLLSVIRQQRHLASRVIIATQEPTLSPKLLDLTSVTIVHRFTSPEWLNTLKFHLAGASAVHPGSARILEEIFDTVVNLKPGEALLFSPSAMLRVTKELIRKGITTEKVKKLGMHYMKIRVRKRLTADGGRSIMAT